MGLLDSVISAGTKIYNAVGGAQGVAKIATTAAAASQGSSGGTGYDTKDYFEQSVRQNFVAEFTKLAEEAKKKMEEELKKGDPGAV